ncbi:hypothetical protein INR49_007397, partial [Caranx melampygus]
MSSQVRLRLLPSARCLFDEPIQLKVSGLRSRQVVALRARSTDERGVEFSSSATYRADGSGEIDLDRDPSLSGSYVGVEPMGLLWSMRADTLHERFQKRNSLNPHEVRFSVHEEDGEGRMLAEATNERCLIGDGVVRSPVKEGSFQGVLFTPPGEGPFPAVLDVATFVTEKRACLLANKGYVVLAIAVNNDKPGNIKVMHLDRFEEAVNFLQQQPKVGSKGVGVLSLSKGGDIALSLAAFVPGVEATVWINGCNANVAFPLYYRKRQILPALSSDIRKMIPTESGAAMVKHVLDNPMAEENKSALIPIEQAKSRFLFAAAEDDLNWDSKAYMDEMVERLKHHGKENYESVSYPRAGHLLEPPYGPYCPSSFHGFAGTVILWGVSRGLTQQLKSKSRAVKREFVTSDKMSSQVRLRLLPSARCLFDEPVQVKVSGLRSRQVVALRARSTDERGVEFSSSATYRADGSGKIDLDRDPSLSGSYVGVEPMGLLWSMRADTLHERFEKTNSLNPHEVRFSVHEEDWEGRMLAEATNERCLIGDGVVRSPVKEGSFQGVLFTPPGEGPFPAVLDVATFVTEKRACLLANRGFVVLAIAVNNDKPGNIKVMHLDHFEEAVNFLQQQPKVGSKGVGALSLSKGGDIALSLAAFVPGVEATVWINGCNANVAFPLYYRKSQILPALRFDIRKMIPTESGANMVKHVLDNPMAEENKSALIPIEQAKGRFLFAAAEDDLNWDSKAYMDEMVERLKHHGKENYESVSYPGAGHYLEPPYGPYCPSSFHAFAGTSVVWGGEPRSHAAAEVHLWKKIQEFFKAHLR